MAGARVKANPDYSQDGNKHGRRYSSMDKTRNDDIHIHANFRFFEADNEDNGGKFLEWLRPCRNAKRQKYYAEGFLLKSLERDPMFQYVSMTYWDVTSLFPKEKKPPVEIIARCTGGRLYQPVQRPEYISTKHGMYEEEETIAREGTTILPKRPTSDNTIYYLMAFKTDGNAESLAMSWRTWTGADFVLWKCPEELCLQRVSFYKHLAPNTDDVMFILLSECSEGLTNQQAALHFLGRLRDRRCGHVGVYKLDQHY